MITLAMLPSFHSYTYVGGRAFGFMLVSCSLAYIIKVFYFDVTDDLEIMVSASSVSYTHVHTFSTLPLR